MKLFSELYPCTHCQHHFAKDFKELPPRLDSRKEFVLWMCEIHNKVVYFDDIYKLTVDKYYVGQT